MKREEAPRKSDCRPRIVVVADDNGALALLRAEIEGRYGGAYSVLVAPSPSEALKSLEALRAAGQRVAVVLPRQRRGAESCFGSPKPVDGRDERLGRADHGAGVPSPFQAGAAHLAG